MFDEVNIIQEGGSKTSRNADIRGVKSKFDNYFEKLSLKPEESNETASTQPNFSSNKKNSGGKSREISPVKTSPIKEQKKLKI